MTYLPPDPVTPPPTRGAWLKASEFDPRFYQPVTPAQTRGAWLKASEFDPRFYQPVTPAQTRGAWLKMVVPVRVNRVSVGMILAN